MFKHSAFAVASKVLVQSLFGGTVAIHHTQTRVLWVRVPCSSSTTTPAVSPLSEHALRGGTLLAPPPAICLWVKEFVCKRLIVSVVMQSTVRQITEISGENTRMLIFAINNDLSNLTKMFLSWLPHPWLKVNAAPQLSFVIVMPCRPV